MSDDLVLYETDGQVGLVTLNRPSKLNALDRDTIARLQETLLRADRDPGTCVVVLRGEGRSFCVGYDLAAPHEIARPSMHWQDLLNSELEFEALPWTMRKPVIASVQGHALGGGCELAMMCDLTVAAEDAKFGEPEIRFSVSGPVFILPWLIGLKRAKELLYFGDMVDAPTALAWGMVNRVVPTAELRDATLKLARRLALIGPEALARTKAAINRGAEAGGLMTALRMGVNAVVPLYADETEIGAAFKEKAAAEGVAAAVRWRNAQFKTD